MPAIPESIQNAFIQLIQSIGLPDLQFDEHGRCGLESSNGFTIHIHCDANAKLLRFQTFLGELSEDKRLHFCEMLLTANARIEISGGGIFGIDLFTDSATYAYNLPFERADGPTLQQILASFLQNAETWRTRIHQEAAEENLEQESDSDSDSDSNLPKFPDSAISGLRV